MTKIQICKKDGTPTHFFWMQKDGTDRTRETVYKQVAGAPPKKMKGVHFDAVNNRMLKD